MTFLALGAQSAALTFALGRIVAETFRRGGTQTR
jgi:hypothetical protein